MFFVNSNTKKKFMQAIRFSITGHFILQLTPDLT